MVERSKLLFGLPQTIQKQIDGLTVVLEQARSIVEMKPIETRNPSRKHVTVLVHCLISLASDGKIERSTKL